MISSDCVTATFVSPTFTIKHQMSQVVRLVSIEGDAYEVPVSVISISNLIKMLIPVGKSLA